MMANIVILTLIAAYCIYLIYKGCKNMKEGKHPGCAGCSGNCGSCGGCTGHTEKYKKERLKGDFKMGSSTGSMFYAFGAFLILYLVGASIYQIFLWIRKWREKKENDIEEK